MQRNADHLKLTLQTTQLKRALEELAARRMGIVAAENVVNGLDGVPDPELIFNRQLFAAWRLGQLA